MQDEKKLQSGRAAATLGSVLIMKKRKKVVRKN